MIKKQVLLNIFTNFLSVVVSMFIAFFITPFIIASIGKEAYSFVPLSNNFIQYLAIFTVALTSMTSRYVTIQIHKQNYDSANEFYSSSAFANGIIACIVFLFGIVIILNLESFINIPYYIVQDVKLLFTFTLLALFVNVSTSIFTIASFSMNRLDVTNTISIITQLIRLLLIIVLYFFFQPRVYYIGFSFFVFILCQSFLFYFFGKSILPVLRFRYKNIKFKLIKVLFESGIWNAFNQLSSVLLTGMDIMIANIYLGASEASILSISKTVPLAIQSLIIVVPSAFYPQLTINYANNSTSDFVEKLKTVMKFCSIITAIPIAIYFSTSFEFFKLWLPFVSDDRINWLSYLTSLSLVANFSILPLIYVFTVTNKLKVPSLFVFASGLVNILVVLLSIKSTNLGLYAIAGVSSFIEICRCFIFVPVYSAICLKQNYFAFYKQIFSSLAFFIVLVSIFVIFVKFYPIVNWLDLVNRVSIMAGCGVLIGYLVFGKEHLKRLG